MHYICIASWLAMLVAIAPASPQFMGGRATPSIDSVIEESMAEPKASILPSVLFTPEQVIEGQIELLKSMTGSPSWYPSNLLMHKAIGALERVVRDENCPAPFEYIHGCCYYFSNTDNRTATWDGAVTACETLGEGMTPKLATNLAEVGQDNYRCDDVKFMDYIGKQGVSHGNMWFGAQASGNRGPTWDWRETETIFSANSNMWWPTSQVYTPENPEPSKHHSYGPDQHCLMSYSGGDQVAAPRAYFAPETCNTHLQYVCQIFY